LIRLGLQLWNIYGDISNQQYFGFVISANGVTRPLEPEARSADKTTVAEPSTLVLSFILAIVVGYFTGRTVGVVNRIRPNRDA
jgi:hypothetical protein